MPKKQLREKLANKGAGLQYDGLATAMRFGDKTGTFKHSVSSSRTKTTKSIEKIEREETAALPFKPQLRLGVSARCYPEFPIDQTDFFGLGGVKGSRT